MQSKVVVFPLEFHNHILNPEQHNLITQKLKPRRTRKYPAKRTSPSFFFVTLNPPKPTLRAPAKRTRKHHADPPSPTLSSESQSRHWSGGFVWFRCGSLGLLGFVDCVVSLWYLIVGVFDLLEKKSCSSGVSTLWNSSVKHSIKIEHSEIVQTLAN